MIVLDTNVLSELLRPEPDGSIEAWLAAQQSSSIFITTVTEAEIRYGVWLLPQGKRRRELEAAITASFAEDFAGRILPFDSAAAIGYAEIASVRRAAGRPISQFDAQIAAITSSRGASLATRNIGDFQAVGLRLVNPWAWAG